MHEGAVYNTARMAMPGQTMNVLADECQEGVALFCVSMQEYVLDHKVPEFVLAKLRCINEDVVHKLRYVGTGTLFNEPFNDTAAKAVTSSIKGIAFQLLEHETHAGCWGKYDAPLQDMIRMGRYTGLPHMTSELLCQCHPF